jgi:hypothetical protein
MDRALLNIEPRRTRFAAAAGSTLTDAGIETTESTESVWDNDYNFIAPAQ